MMLGNPGGPPPFLNRNRRQPSIGGPPKAVLGGPGRKNSPLPVAAPTPVPKVKKHTVNLPKETPQNDDGEPSTRPSWARTNVDHPFEYADVSIPPPESSSRDFYPEDNWCRAIPDTLEVFLPGKSSWDEIQRQLIEEKLEKMGIEPVQREPPVHVPHARAASISSPADPALLYFKLNKLQQSQGITGPHSLSSSPQPPYNLEPSPNGAFYATNRHGHSLSLAQHPTYMSPDTSNLFSGGAFGSQVQNQSSFPTSPTPLYSSDLSSHIVAPQGRVPVNINGSRPDSRPNFAIGFGLDIPEEEEEELAEKEDENDNAAAEELVQELTEEDDTHEETKPYESCPGEDTAEVLSRIHSRHVSRLSASLQQQQQPTQYMERAKETVSESAEEPQVADEEPSSPPVLDEAADWTATEDQYDASDDESIGEWSNPSDEERARQQRVERRMRKRNASLSEHAPRRLPSFPYPPISPYPAIQSEDDFISNPSEDERQQKHTHAAPHFLHVQPDDYHVPESALSSGKTPRPLPPLPSLPHSRGPSIHSQYPDPSSAHSRSGSFQRPEMGSRTESLNPHAKPFVFGAKAPIWAAAPEFQPAVAPANHSRGSSVGGMLSAAAPEFKPSFGAGFIFQAPAGVPKMPAALAPAALSPLAEASIENTPARPQQGREKRQRLDPAEETFVEEGDSILSFKFPASKLDSPAPLRRQQESPSPPPMPLKRSSLNPDAQPFTFNMIPQMVHDSPLEDIIRLPISDDEDENISPYDISEPTDKLPKRRPFADLVISPTKARSVSMHMDFRHPVSQNTVPAGLFKALANGEERTRRTVRSRLSSREIFENLRQPSLDDIDVPTISRKVSRQHFVTDPGARYSSPEQDVSGQVPTHARRRSSLPNQPIRSPSNNSISSHMSIVAAADLTGRFEMHQYEGRLEELLDKKLARMQRQLLDTLKAQSERSSTDATAEVLSLFRTQLLQSASRGLEDSQLDARGELDFELFKDIVHEAQTETRSLLKADIKTVLDHVGRSELANAANAEHLREQILRSVSQSVSHLLERLSLSRGSEITVDGVVAALAPLVSSMRTEPLDYDFLTSQLSQAVKPHISQLIDLASDKAETAGLIVARILPLLPTPTPPMDTEALTSQLISEIRRAIAPIDPFEIKEQVADLVVERLDSRLAVRDKAFNVDSIATKLSQAVQSLIPSQDALEGKVDGICNKQKTLAEQYASLAADHRGSQEVLSKLPERFAESAQSTISELTKVMSEMGKGSPEAFQGLGDKLDQVLGDKSNQELLSGHKAILEQLDSVPSFITSTTDILQHIQTEMALSVRAAQRESEELRRSNADYQVQLAKARSAHGQIRVDKDRIEEKQRETETERNQMRSRIKQLEEQLESKSLENVSLEAKCSKQEDGLSQALSRLQASDVDKQATRSQIAELEAAKRETTADNQSLKAQVDALKMDGIFAARDKETAVEALSSLQQRYDDLAAQQSHWNSVNKTAAQVEKLTTMFGQLDNQEIKELRRVRDSSKVLEGEHAALQKRYQDLEKKVANLEKSAATTRQNHTQAQQRNQQKVSELERKSRDLEGRVETLGTEVEQWEQTHAQLDTDYTSAKQQLEEKESHERHMKDREAHLQDQINTLEGKNKQLQTDLIQAQQKAFSAPVHLTNGKSSHYDRPSSRASTVLVDCPNGNGRSPGTDGSATPPAEKSVWDSVHAPKASEPYQPSYQAKTPARRYPNLGVTAAKSARPTYPSYRRAASPTPSVVSVAPTLGDDGWYS